MAEAEDRNSFTKDVTSGSPLAGGQVVLTSSGLQSILVSLVSDENGFVSFDEIDLEIGVEYTVAVSVPSGYTCLPGSCATTYVYDGSISEIIILNMEPE